MKKQSQHLSAAGRNEMEIKFRFVSTNWMFSHFIQASIDLSMMCMHKLILPIDKQRLLKLYKHIDVARCERLQPTFPTHTNHPPAITDYFSFSASFRSVRPTFPKQTNCLQRRAKIPWNWNENAQRQR